MIMQRRSAEQVQLYRREIEQKYGMGRVGDFYCRSFDRFAVEAGDDVSALDAHLKGRGLIARRVDGYGLPGHLRISVGSEEACRLVAEAIAQFKAGT